MFVANKEEAHANKTFPDPTNRELNHNQPDHTIPARMTRRIDKCTKVLIVQQGGIKFPHARTTKDPVPWVQDNSE